MNKVKTNTYTLMQYTTRPDRFFVSLNGRVCATLVIEPGQARLRIGIGIRLTIEVTALDPERLHYIVDRDLLQLCIDKYNEIF